MRSFIAMTHGRPLRLLVAVTAVLLLATGADPARAEAQPGDLLPNLRQEVPAELAVETGPRGRPVLRFSTTTMNAGSGPLTLEGRRDGDAMRVDQRVTRSDGSTRVHPNVGTLRYAVADRHAHWQLDGFVEYRLTRLDRGRTRRRRDAARCLGDRRLAAWPAPLVTPTPVYEGWCGRGQPSLEAVTQGLSVGFAVPRPSTPPGPALDLSGLRAGRYVLTQAVNPDRRLLESDHDDSSSSLLIALHPRRRGAAGARVLRICDGRPWCPPGPTRSAPRLTPGISYGHLQVGPRIRSYRLTVPHGLAKRNARLVVMLHGGGTNESGRRFADAIGFDREAERRGWIAVYPDAVAGRFNGGRCCNAAVDDVRFIDTLIAEITRRLGRRPRHVVAAGFSNGGFLAYRLACERSRRVTAIAVVATSEVTRRCRPTDPVSVLHIHGGRDPKLPPTGGWSWSPSLPAVTERWARRNGCRRRDVDVTATAIDRRATGCRRGSSVRTLLLRDRGHEWPGANPPHGAGAEDAVSATEMIGAFFDRVFR